MKDICSKVYDQAIKDNKKWDVIRSIVMNPKNMWIMDSILEEYKDDYMIGYTVEDEDNPEGVIDMYEPKAEKQKDELMCERFNELWKTK
jgi:hypothetical protein